jgi:hypothetical protein
MEIARLGNKSLSEAFGLDIKKVGGEITGKYSEFIRLFKFSD